MTVSIAQKVSKASKAKQGKVGLPSFNEWSEEEKKAWAAEQAGLPELPELFPEDNEGEDDFFSESDEISDVSELTLKNDETVINNEDAEGIEGLGAHFKEVDAIDKKRMQEALAEDAANLRLGGEIIRRRGLLNDATNTESPEDKLNRIQAAFDDVKTVQGIITIARVTTAKVEGWKCLYRQLLDKESDAEVSITGKSSSELVGAIFNDMVSDLIELAGLDKTVWDSAEITKVRFPQTKDGKVSNLMISGINPGVYGQQSVTCSVALTDCLPNTQARVKKLEIAVSAWVERRILEAEKKPLQASLFDMLGAEQKSVEKEEE
jgi:hypothetical protein